MDIYRYSPMGDKLKRNNAVRTDIVPGAVIGIRAGSVAICASVNPSAISINFKQIVSFQLAPCMAAVSGCEQEDLFAY